MEVSIQEIDTCIRHYRANAESFRNIAATYIQKAMEAEGQVDIWIGHRDEYIRRMAMNNVVVLQQTEQGGQSA